MSGAVLAGIARVVPDVLTFATPIFSDQTGNYLSQRENEDVIAGFDTVSIGQEVSPVSALLSASVGNACIHGFEVAEGEFLFGTSDHLAIFLGKNETIWKGRRGTEELVHRFIERVGARPTHRQETSQILIHTSLSEGNVGASHLSFFDRGEALRRPRLEKSDKTDATLLLTSYYSEILNVSSKNDFQWCCASFAKDLGFDAVFVLAGYDVYQQMTSYLPRLRDVRDPLHQHLFKSALPIIWDRMTYVEAKVPELWEVHANAGVETGIALRILLPNGGIFLFGVERKRCLPKGVGLTRLLAEVQLFAVHAQEAAVKLIQGVDKYNVGKATLSSRELEVLRWTMEGKTALEIGNILCISERTSVLHIQNAMHKLGAVNKHQAVLRALRLGII